MSRVGGILEVPYLNENERQRFESLCREVQSQEFWIRRSDLTRAVVRFFLEHYETLPEGARVAFVKGLMGRM